MNVNACNYSQETFLLINEAKQSNPFMNGHKQSHFSSFWGSFTRQILP